MGGSGSAIGKRGAPGTGTGVTTPINAGPSPTPVSTEYEANRPQQMPVYNSPAQLESARQQRLNLMARSGRTSTNLTGNPGTQTYMNSFLGSI